MTTSNKITVTLGLRWWFRPAWLALIPVMIFLPDDQIEKLAAWLAKHGAWVR